MSWVSERPCSRKCYWYIALQRTFCRNNLSEIQSNPVQSLAVVVSGQSGRSEIQSNPAQSLAVVVSGQSGRSPALTYPTKITFARF